MTDAGVPVPRGRRLGVVGAVVVAALGLAACGPEAPAGSSAPPAPQETWTVTVSPTTGGTTPPAATPAPSESTLPTAAITGGTPTTPPPSRTTARPTATASATAARPGAVSIPAAAKERPSRGGVVMPPTGTGALSGHIVAVDPGHNGVNAPSILTRQVPAGGGRTKICNTTGTADAREEEHALTWSVASALAAELRGRGATVVMTRPDDRGVGPCVDERAAIGNRSHAEVAVSIHADGNESASARGFHVIRSTAMSGGSSVEAASSRFATTVRDAMATTGMPRSTYLGRGTAITPRTDIAGLNLSRIPAVMVEMGNMHHPVDSALLASAGFRLATARALADAVQAQLNAR